MRRLEELSDSLNGLRQRAKVAEDERDRLEGPKEVLCPSNTAAAIGRMYLIRLPRTDMTYVSFK